MAAPALVARQLGATGVSLYLSAIVFIRKCDRCFLGVFMIAVIATHSVSAALRDAYGSGFERATQAERLLFLEVIAFSLRVDDCEFNESLALIFGTPPNMPASLYAPAELGRNEALKLLAVLQVAIVEGYAAAFAE